MCLYCNMGDTWFRHDPPWRRQSDPYLPPSVPLPIIPLTPLVPWTPPEWSLDKLREYLRLLKEVKEMEEKVGCPCEPNKADYIKLFEERIRALEKGKT